MKAPTRKEIEVEIAALKEIKPKIKQFSYFGDDNHAAIDAQISVLELETSNEEIDEKRDSGEWSNHEADSAIHALEWMDGDESEAPSVGWKPLAK
ncbi:MAG: hypothetical protein WCH99_08750 [Verrucomicrobiota bacterium]